ncbi:MAG TPA: hypothetical protein VFO63_09670 [Blastocatellia bacterium]|nr:hypothetical protein [Blastocatellia bacterium]
MNGNGQVDQRLPFRRNTRQRIRQVGAAQTLAGGGSALAATANFQLDRVGLLNYLLVIVRATVTLAGAGTFATLGPWSLINRFRVDLNLGNMNLVDISGWKAYQFAKILFRGWAPDGGGNFAPNATTFSAPVAMGANTWIIPYLIPISANPGSQFDSGLISLQAPEVQVNVQARVAAAGADFVTMFTSVTAMSVELHQCYFEYPDPQAVMLPPGQIVRTVEVSTPIAATGDTIYTIDRQGTLLQLLSTVLLNNARADAGLSRLRLVANINDTIYDLLTPVAKFKNQFDYSAPGDTGVWGCDLWHAGENPSSYDDRDVIDSEVLTTLQWILTADSGLGAAGTNFFNTARRVLVNFAQPGFGPAL